MTTDPAKTALGLGAFALVMLARCGGYDPGIEVQVALRSPAPVQSILTDRGYRVHLDVLAAEVASVRLVPCSGPLVQLRDLLMSTAYAHHVDVSPDQGEGSGTLHLLEANGNPVVITTLRPPPGNYCAAELSLAPATLVPGASGLRVVGTAERQGQTYAFDWRLEQSPLLTFKLSKSLVLSESSLNAQLIFDLDPSRLLDGYEFSTAAPGPPLDTGVRSALQLSHPEIDP